MKNIVLPGIIALIVGCNAPQGHSHQNRTDQPATKTTELSVKLNKGERWTANPETTQGVENMIAIVENFDRSKGDYARLQNELMDEFKTILQKCTMDGEAHNEMHNYLLPLRDKIENASAANLDDIKSHLRAYYQFFE